jgi:hypothetical protein
MDNDLQHLQFQTFAAEVAIHTPRKINGLVVTSNQTNLFVLLSTYLLRE